MHRFYAPDLAADTDVQLPDDEARHLSRVLRLRPGDPVLIFDGKGREALAHIETVGSGRVKVRMIEPRQAAAESRIALTLVQALLKSDKMDNVIRDAVMLGAAAVQPIISQRIDVPRAALRAGGRQQRWNRTVMSSVKQSGRAVVPPVLEVLDFHEWLSATAGRTRLMFVEPGSPNFSPAQNLTSLEAHLPPEAAVLIGPEGGWDPQELEDAAVAGVTLVTFGSRTLRADAAGAIAIALLQYIWKDF